MQSFRKFSSSALQVLLWFAAAAVLVQNLILFRQNERLKTQSVNTVSAGRHLANLSAVNLEGKLERIDLQDGSFPVVIVTFSPSCQFCQATEPVWAALSKELTRQGHRMIWVSRDPVQPTRDYCERTHLPLSDVFADPPNRTFSQLGLQEVPNTIVVRADGIVDRVWTGSLQSEDLGQIQAYLETLSR